MFRLIAVGIFVVCTFLVLAGIPVTGQAHVFKPDECGYLAFLVYQIGTARDEGMSQADVEKALADGIARTKDDPDAFIQDAQDVKMLAGLVNVVFENKDKDPTTIAEFVHRSCQNEAFRSNT